MYKFLSILLNYFISFFLTLVVFLLLEKSGLFVDIYILFFRGVIEIGLAGIISAIVMTIVCHFTKWKIERSLLVVVMALCINLVIWVLVPVTLDRSISIFLLSELNVVSEGLSMEDLEKSFNKNYLQRDMAIQRRVNEQSTIGDVKVEGEKIVITEKGRKLYWWLNQIGTVYGFYNK